MTRPSLHDTDTDAMPAIDGSTMPMRPWPSSTQTSSAMTLPTGLGQLLGAVRSDAGLLRVGVAQFAAALAAEMFVVQLAAIVSRRNASYTSSLPFSSIRLRYASCFAAWTGCASTL
jgi:hypothetical protein